MPPARAGRTRLARGPLNPMDHAPPRWHSGFARGAPGPALVPWLGEPRSLTRRLRRHCGADFSLRLLALYRARPEEHEWRRLGGRHGRIGLIREVALRCAGRPLVYARTVIPLATLHGPYRRLRRLGDRPLADVLFTVRGITRERMEYALLHPGQALHDRAAGVLGVAAEGLWARRSLFLLQRRPLLVTEVFAPGIGRD